MSIIIAETAHQNPEPSLAARAAVRLSHCELCGTPPGLPCTAAGDHLTRWLTAYRKRRVGREDLAAVVAGLVVIAGSVTVPGRAA